MKTAKPRDFFRRFLFLCGIVALALPQRLPAQAQNYTTSSYTFTTLAGNPGYTGTSNGPGLAARFWNTTGVAVDGSGNIYVADQFNHTIRKISSAGYVSTLAGSAGTAGFADGNGPGALFNSPTAVAVDSNAYVYVADMGNGAVRRISPAGMVTTLASGFSTPTGVAVNASGNLVYVTDNGNNAVDKITLSGGVWTRSPSPFASGFNLATNASSTNLANVLVGLALDGKGNVYLADYDYDPAGDNRVAKITSAGTVSTFFSESGGPQGVAVDANNDVYVANANGSVVKINPSGTGTTLAGTAGTFGTKDGPGTSSVPGTSALFWNPTGIAVDGNGNVYVADSVNSNIREITTTNLVTTLAGSAGNIGSNDGPVISTARFNSPSAAAVDENQNVYVADSENNTIREITTAGVVTTFAGKPGVAGTTDGTGAAARFSNPEGVTVDANGILYVADTGNGSIRKITSQGVVSTLITGLGSPNSVALDASGNIWVAVSKDDVVDEFTSDGVFVTSFIFTAPAAVATDLINNVYVASDDAIFEIDSGNVFFFAGEEGFPGSEDSSEGAPLFDTPSGLATDSNGDVFVADSGNNTIREITPDGTVTTLGGLAQSTGFADSEGGFARFNNPVGIAVDGYGYLYVSDTGNDTLRKGYADSPVTSTSFSISVTPGMVGQSQAQDYEFYLNQDGYEFPFCTIVSGPATLSDNILTFTGTGTVVVSFNDNSGQPPSVPIQPSQPPSTNPVAAGQTIVSFSPAISTATVGQQVTLNGMSSSGLPIAYSVVSGPAQISGDDNNVVTFMNPGTVVLEADQSGDDMYKAAAAVQQNVTVTNDQAPVITSAASAIFTVGTSNSFLITTSGFPTPALTEQTNLPSGVTFVDNGNGTATLAGNPAENANGSYTLTLTANNGVGTAATQTFTLKVQTEYAQWAAENFTSAQSSNQTFIASTSTPLNDGVPNLVKYAFDINPSVPMTEAERAALPTVGLDTTTNIGSEYLTVTYRQYAGLAATTHVKVQTCSDLHSWSTVTPNITKPTVLPDGDIMIEDEVLITGSTKEFIRLKVNGP